MKAVLDPGQRDETVFDHICTSLHSIVDGGDSLGPAPNLRPRTWGLEGPSPGREKSEAMTIS